MEFLNSVVHIQSKTIETRDITAIFAKCGEIRALYPVDTSRPGESHFMLHFEDAASSKRALNLEGHQMKVLPVAKNPQLISQYRSVNSAAFNPPPDSKRSNENAVRRVPKTAQPPGKATISSKAKSGLVRLGVTALSDCLNTPSQPASTSSAPLPPATQVSTGMARPSTGPFMQFLNSSRTLISNPRRKARRSNHLEFAASAPYSAPSITTSPPKMPASASVDMSNGPYGSFFTLNSCITLGLSGQTITYNLDSLDSDPRGIIALLKNTSSERGNWMVVAAYYRRKGNARAAIHVATAMLSVMADIGIPEKDLTPAFLMLSGCETDLGKRARDSGADEARIAEHYANSQKWLQRVYGTISPSKSVDLTQQTSGPSSESTVVTDKTIVAVARPIKPMPLSSGVNRTVPTAPRRNTVNMPPSADKPSQGASATLRPTGTLELEREIKTLQDIHAAQTNLLSETVSAKRKAEEELANERKARKKLEKRLDEVQKELVTEKRMEMWALEQTKKEVTARRRAEEMVVEEKAKRRACEREAAAEKRASKPLFEDLASMFQRAAQGDGMASIAGMISRTSSGAS